MVPPRTCRYHLLLLISLVAAPSTTGHILKTLKEAGEDTVSAVATPIQKTVVDITLKNCEPVKQFFGLTYNQLVDSGEPDVKQLTIDLIGNNKTKEVYNITETPKKLFKSELFDVKKPVTIFLHGFLSSSESSAAKQLTNSLVARGDTNVLALDSSGLIKYFYLKSSTCVRFIGKELGRVLADMKKGGIDPSKIHIIGHSLGSHIAGFSGKMYHNITGKKLGRISALDPAGPCFFRESGDLRLQETDAEFIDVVHSDAGVFGLIDPVGHVDFYPNKGEAQPGCPLPPCSHSRAWELYNETILSPEDFPAVKCRGWDTFVAGNCDKNEKTFMGFKVDPTKRGVFYFKTKGQFPFGLNRPKPLKKNDDDASLVSKVFSFI